MAKMLTAKREAFCQAYFRGTVSATAAWRQAGFGPGASDATAKKRASELLALPDIQDRLTELREGVAQASLCTLQSHLATLATIRELAMADGKYNAAAAAEIARGKAVGLYIDRVAVGGQVELIERPDLSKLNEAELEAMLAMMKKAGATDVVLQ